MRRLTSQASDVLRELQEKRRPLLSLVGRPIDRDLVGALARIGDPMAVPALIPLLIGTHPAMLDHIASVVDSLVRSVPPVDLPEFAEACRALGAYDVVDWNGWRNLSPRDIRTLGSSLGQAGAFVVGVASFHRSGYVREAAVAELDAIETGEELSFLMLRLNDWVAPVFDAAREAAERRIGSKWARAWAANLAVASRVGASTRRSNSHLIDRVFRVLREADHGDALGDALRSPDRLTRRVAFHLAAGSAAFPLATIVRLAFEDADPLIRLEALRDGLPLLDDASFRALLEAIDANPFMPVRRAGLLTAAERFPDQAITRAERALMDRHAAIREIARFQLQQRDPTRTFASVYRAEIGSTEVTNLSTAIVGLGETGAKADTDTIEPFLSHERPSVRQAAVRALARLDAEANGRAFLRALRDSSPRVIGAAKVVLTTHPALIEIDEIRRLVGDAPTLAGRMSALALSQSLGKWRNLAVLLEGSMQTELAVADHARQLLRMWLVRINRSSVPPTRAELTDIDTTFARTRFSIDNELRRQIAGTLDAWR